MAPAAYEEETAVGSSSDGSSPLDMAPKIENTLDQGPAAPECVHAAGPREVGIVPYGDTAEQRNSQFQLAWQEVMSVGNYTSSTSYKKVEVLLLSWDGDGDDLGVKKEIDDLAAVFETTFNYGITIERLKRHQGKTAQSYINMVVAAWVWEMDGPRTLLIVYFAGHGRKGDKNELKLAGRMQPRDYRAHLDTVVWNRTEENLRDTQSDVLEIFDCCYAGNLTEPHDRGSSVEPRAFEYLAAAPASKRTPGPGEKSFTTALIWSLKRLASQDKGRFTTEQLLYTIKNQAPGFNRQQEPVFSKRDDTGGEFIILSPLQPDAVEGGDKILPNPASSHSDANHRTVLTLKFVFNKGPSMDDIRMLGNNFNMMTRQYDFNMNRIMWGGLHSHTKDSVFAAASRFQSLLRARSSRSSGQTPTLGSVKRLPEVQKTESNGIEEEPPHKRQKT